MIKLYFLPWESSTELWLKVLVLKFFALCFVVAFGSLQPESLHSGVCLEVVSVHGGRRQLPSLTDWVIFWLKNLWFVINMWWGCHRFIVTVYENWAMVQDMELFLLKMWRLGQPIIAGGCNPICQWWKSDYQLVPVSNKQKFLLWVQALVRFWLIDQPDKQRGQYVDDLRCRLLMFLCMRAEICRNGIVFRIQSRQLFSYYDMMNSFVVWLFFWRFRRLTHRRVFDSYKYVVIVE